MSPSRLVPPVLSLLLCGLLAAGCTVLKVDSSDSGWESDAVISGHLTAGWPDDQAVIELDLLQGHNDGAILWFNVWKLFRVEIGLVGASVGVGPLDIGFGVLFYEAYPPHYSTNWFGVHGGDEDHHGDDDHGWDDDDD